MILLVVIYGLIKLGTIQKLNFLIVIQLKDTGHRRSVIAALHKANVLDKCNWSYVNNTCDGSWFDSALGFTQQDIDYAHSIDDIRFL